MAPYTVHEHSDNTHTHTHTHNGAPQPVGLLCTSDQLVAEPATSRHTTLTAEKPPSPPQGFEPTIAGGERPQTLALDRAATATGNFMRQIDVIHSYNSLSYDRSKAPSKASSPQCDLDQRFSTAGRGPEPGHGIKYTGPREVLLEFVILVF